MKTKIYGVYDIKNNEQCIGIFDKLQEVVDYLDIKNVRVLASAISKKNVIKTKYRVVRIEEKKYGKQSNS